jgi:hypothetical protein
METVDPLSGRIRAFTYITAEKAVLYRAVMRVFTEGTIFPSAELPRSLRCA